MTGTVVDTGKWNPNAIYILGHELTIEEQDKYVVLNFRDGYTGERFKFSMPLHCVEELIVKLEEKVNKNDTV